MTTAETQKVQKAQEELTGAERCLDRFFRGIEQGKTPGELKDDFTSAVRGVLTTLKLLNGLLK